MMEICLRGMQMGVFTRDLWRPGFAAVEVAKLFYNWNTSTHWGLNKMAVIVQTAYMIHFLKNLFYIDSIISQ